MSLSNRCLKGLKVENGPMELNLIYFGNPYHEENNQQGYIRLSCADNHLCKDILLEKFRSINWLNFNDEEIVKYTVPGGQYSTRKVFADLMNEFMLSDIRYPIKPEEILVISGATMICDLLSHVLFDEGEIMLAHSPFYHRFLNDFIDRGLIDIVSIPTMFEDSIKAELKVELYEKAFQKAVSEGKTVRAILIVNPRNPDGGYWSLTELKPIIN
uniref:Aminotransferase class I/classII domain-containing protein n=1 Tax=Panagrolaimus superbus TaxID=310955 RepID=A0A914Y083_9BILA